MARRLSDTAIDRLTASVHRTERSLWNERNGPDATLVDDYEPPIRFELANDIILTTSTPTGPNAWKLPANGSAPDYGSNPDLTIIDPIGDIISIGQKTWSGVQSSLRGALGIAEWINGKLCVVRIQQMARIIRCSAPSTATVTNTTLIGATLMGTMEAGTQPPSCPAGTVDVSNWVNWAANSSMEFRAEWNNGAWEFLQGPCAV
jgi:hypothetical protein